MLTQWHICSTVIRYLDGIISWAQEDIDATGVKK